jgi:hypothetical protein
MLLKRVNNLFVILIILCSTGFYNFSKLGSGQKAAELMGAVMIIALLAMHLIYSDQLTFKKNFVPFILLIFLGAASSIITANYVKEQTITASIFAERAVFYYFFYFLLHQLKIRPRDLEIIFIIFAVIHVCLYLLQYFAYPKILFDVYMMADRGTIRIYLKGSDYLALCFFMSMYFWLKTNKLIYAIYMLAAFSIFLLLGGRQTIALMILVLVLAVFFTRQVRSRLFISVMIVISAACVFYMFQDIFKELLVTSNRDRSQGSSYVRIKAAKYFLTTFYKTPVAYITGNGVPGSSSEYASEMSLIRVSKGFYLGDIGLIGTYIMYGIFFIIGVAGIFFKAFKTKIQEHYRYIKFMFLGSMLSLVTGSGFGEPDFICFICCLMYLIDVTSVSYDSTAEKEITNLNRIQNE